jgi:hypothetical protein
MLHTHLGIPFADTSNKQDKIHRCSIKLLPIKRSTRLTMHHLSSAGRMLLLTHSILQSDMVQSLAFILVFYDKLQMSLIIQY